MFSGWGVRTLSDRSPRYNPQGYHLGTVWPHDNSLLAMGLRRYGLAGEVGRLASALFAAARSFPYCRLPELFGGNEISAFHAPVPYPVACRPQAWAAGSFLLITQAMLGLCADAPARTLYVVAPVLPEVVNTLDYERISVGEASVDLRFERAGASVEATVREIRGDLRIVTVPEWPLTHR
jgi:glycogen debranching enzyme